MLHACLWALSWGCAITLLQLEHTRVLAHDRTRGHGTVLLLFWALAFAAENLTLACWRSPLWWWGLEDTNQKVGWTPVGREAGHGTLWGGLQPCGAGLGCACHALPCPGCAHSQVAPMHLLHVWALSSAVTHLSLPLSSSAPASGWRSPRCRGRGCLAAPHCPLSPCSPQGMVTPSWRAQSWVRQGGRKGAGCCLGWCVQPGGPAELCGVFPFPWLHCTLFLFASLSSCPSHACLGCAEGWLWRRPPAFCPGTVWFLAAALHLHIHALHSGHEGPRAAPQALHAAGQ